ncbi:alveolin domain containing intermediate filament IMC6 [Toxoplasma gondii ME49]|uniref:Alveolin domain containing intermediate filament IMC6 n=8 Tax=Toxoplasma gondii TaxID=5811 RepID=A0A0F7UR59_TOXGV|nr:alveolin domain containing intermediate filament IMC6 [Toxoplasma gondii ME49]ESS28453.1 alveolin domain containing intermediate filament IMC6 [Toxoplasma gondii VEG]KFG30493.1 alveolin domain containing intermediate filament IMC6 [Toxoplasma gondii GAB2-2007-GAL-DOM2]KFG63002.1 alveolin domain containing intermediate filament IMC6 [Toxoplasma gondii RUB]KFH00081.1 alveolin domain containing intermediate filament IMC6 [Toxoplasma gondii VAND]KFH05336.1 alveolin domain containing intermediat|eukprot:XP_002371552.1 alveolin domain containing intermediate filament IMC6 [Toxoplasma gondii ME49]
MAQTAPNQSAPTSGFSPMASMGSFAVPSAPPSPLFPTPAAFPGAAPQSQTVPGVATMGSVAGSEVTPFPMYNWHQNRVPVNSGGFFGQCCGPAQVGSDSSSETYDRSYEENMWRWTRDGKLQLRCGQPVVPVPVIQEIHRRDKIIEVPQVDVVDAVRPKVYNQGVEHEVPVMQINADHEDFDVEQIKYVEKEVVVPIVTGFTHKFVAKWDIREVPRPVVKYVGKQEEIEVEVPQVKFVDKVVEHEVVVDTIEKKVPKIIEVPKYVDEVKYVWTPVEKIVHVERFVPVFDVSLECPAPLIVPYPMQAVKEMPAVMVRKEVPEAAITEQGFDIVSPPGTLRVSDEYVRAHHQFAEENAALCGAGTACGAPQKEPEIEFRTANQMKEARAAAQEGHLERGGSFVSQVGTESQVPRPAATDEQAEGSADAGDKQGSRGSSFNSEGEVH